MGITISHGAMQAPYYAFDRWRTHLFRAAGYGELRTVDGFFDPDDDDDWPNGVPDDVVVRHLKDVMRKSDGLWPLFDLEDSGSSRIATSALPPLIRRLHQLLKEHPEQFDENMREGTNAFIAGVERARGLGEALIVNEDEEEERPRRRWERARRGHDRLHDALADLTDIVERVSRHEPTSDSMIDDAVERLRTAINEVRA